MSAIERMTVAAALERDAFGSSSADEATAVRVWLNTLFPRYDYVAFNVRLGDGRASAPSTEWAIERMWRSLTQRRADVIGWYGRDMDVVEVKHHARMQAVTQVRLYALLAKDAFPDVDRVRPVIVCRSCSSGVETAMRNVGGHVEIV